MKTATATSNRYEVRSVSRALDVLDAIARSPSGRADLGEVARITSLHPSTVFRLLETLIDRQFVVQGPNGYSIGPRAFEVGSAFLRGATIWSKASEIAESLADVTGETASVGILDAAEVLYIAIAHGQSDFGIQSVPGTRHPAHCTALGKAMLATLDPAQVRHLLDGVTLNRLTDNTLTTCEALLEELARVRREGVAIDNEERAVGIRCVGAPIWEHTGKVAAVSASGPSFRMQGHHFEQVRAAVIAAGAEASRRLGGTAHTDGGSA